MSSGCAKGCLVGPCQSATCHLAGDADRGTKQNEMGKLSQATGESEYFMIVISKKDAKGAQELKSISVSSFPGCTG